MPFIDKSTLTYPAANSFPIRKWLDTRDPVSGANGDYKNFRLFDVWVNNVAERAWMLVNRTSTSGTWIQIATSGPGILTVTGDSGGAVGPDGANNLNLLGSGDLSVTGSPGTNTLTLAYSPSARPVFTAFVSATLTSVTGDGTTYTVVFDGEDIDVGGNFDTSTGIYTAPEDGTYLFVNRVVLSNLNSNHINSFTNVTTSFKNYNSGVGDPFVVQAGNGVSYGGTCIVPLSMGDIARVDVQVSGGTKTANVRGGLNPYSYFCGYLLP